MNRKCVSVYSIKRCYSEMITSSESLNYCIKNVRDNDYENFLCTMLLPHNLITTGLVIRAFNVEVASVLDHTSENIIAQMRFKFWEDSIDKTFSGNPPQQPVCLQLHNVLSKHKLSKQYFKRLISARINNLACPTFLDLELAETYAENSVSPLYYLLLEASGIKNIHADHAASHLGKAQGMANLLRGSIYYARKNLVVIPQDLLLKHNVSQESILRGKCDKNTKEVIFDIASRINFHLNKMKDITKNVDKKFSFVYLPSIPVEMYLKNLRSYDFDIFHPKLQLKNYWLPLKLYWKQLF